jgi:glycosyltransferase involved in cell wall biosynthesis
LLRACGRLAKAGQSFHLVIAGDGKERQRLERLAHEQVPAKVRFVGKVKREQMAQFYSAGDLFVFPGIRESLGMVYLESQSCGLPVVAFDNGGIPEVVASGQTGFLTPLRKEEPFVTAIQDLLEDKDLRRAMGAKAAAYVRQHHDLNHNYGIMEKQLQQIVGARQDA